MTVGKKILIFFPIFLSNQPKNAEAREVLNESTSIIDLGMRQLERNH